MTIRRSAISGDRVAVLQRAALQDTRLSFRALGLLVAILSRPADWQTDSIRLARERKEGRDAIRACLTELQECGYLIRARVQDDRGHWSTTWDLSDEPIATPREQDELHETAGHTGDGIPGVGRPDVGPSGAIQEVKTGGSTQESSSDQSRSDLNSGTREPAQAAARQVGRSSPPRHPSRAPAPPRPRRPRTMTEAAAWDMIARHRPWMAPEVERSRFAAVTKIRRYLDVAPDLVAASERLYELLAIAAGDPENCGRLPGRAAGWAIRQAVLDPPDTEASARAKLVTALEVAS